MAESGEELDEFEITMNGLTSQFREMEVPMDRGLVNIRVRRKLMSVGEEEEINFQGGFYRSKAHRTEEKSLGNVVSGEFESLQEELGRTKKELEDAEYLNNKLKNDREVLMAAKQGLELEIETMIIQITKEISILRQHYNSRMSIR
jgi:chromosome segregation ATPase